MNIADKINVFLPNSRITLYALTDQGAYQIQGPGPHGTFSQEQALVIAQLNPDLELVASGELPELPETKENP